MATKKGSEPLAANQLKQSHNPYLRQHADNPVHWHPWSDTPFALANQQGRLIFLSIGYSTCHWCHVMERESFTDLKVAEILNRDFISIKVDREERPDIDQLYMQVCTVLTGSGGWPLTLLITPDKIPVFAGTYIPKSARHGRPGLIDILTRAAQLWKDQPARLTTDGTRLLQQLKRHPPEDNEGFSNDYADVAEQSLRRTFDHTHGGFGQAPKFPRPHLLRFLLQRYHQSRDPALLKMVESTLQKVRWSGSYDQLGFGLHRYATDRAWQVPHFEKMLYDQAGWAQINLDAWQLSGDDQYAATAREIFHYVLEQLRHREGGFYCAEDADSEGVEGRFYLWTKEQIVSILGPVRGERFSRLYRIEDSAPATHPEEARPGTILHRTESLAEYAGLSGISVQQLAAELDADRRALLRERNKRSRPFCDDKVLTSWNAQMISALANGARTLKHPPYLETAVATADFILTRLRDRQGNLLRRWRNGDAATHAFSEDYAFLALALLDLYRADFEPRWLQSSLELAENLYQRFSNPHGLLYDRQADGTLPLDTCTLHDGASPSATSTALMLFDRLYRLTDDARWNNRTRALLNAAAPEVKRAPEQYCQLLNAAAAIHAPLLSLIIVGPENRDDTSRLFKIAGTIHRPELTVLFRPEGNSAAIDRLLPFVQRLTARDGKASAYLCENRACRPPVTEPEELEEMLRSPQKSFAGQPVPDVPSS